MSTQDSLPELLVAHSGERIATVAAWRETRRPELLELFRHHVFGRSPIDPPQLTFTLDESSPTAMDGLATRKQISIHIHGPHGHARLPFLLFVPKRRPAPAPAFVYISIGDRDPTRQTKSPQWPAEMLIERGYAAAAFQVDDLAPNLPSKMTHDFRSSIHACFDSPDIPRPADAWATLAAWAWGASRVMDYLVTDSAIDSARIAVAGHSRAGKTALWSAAQDERFAMAVSVQSGCSGAALHRGKTPGAESIANITAGFPRWFCSNYPHFAGQENTLPFDQHMLLALIAPRLLYVSSATEDTWACPPNEFAACVHAAPAWKLFNLPAMENAPNPSPDIPLHHGPIAYHLRSGPHSLTPADWQHYLDFADKNL